LNESGNRQLTVTGPTDRAFDDAGITADGDRAEFVATGIGASNGVIHAIDGVLMPRLVRPAGPDERATRSHSGRPPRFSTWRRASTLDANPVKHWSSVKTHTSVEQR